MNGLSFILETPYIVNFRKPYSTITLLSFPFPPFTTIRGLIASAMGMGDLATNRDAYNNDLNDLQISLKPLSSPDRFLDMVLMKKLKSPADAKKRREVLEKVARNNYDFAVLDKKERSLYERLCLPQSTSAPFVKEYVTPIKCKVYLKYQDQKRNSLEDIAEALINPARPLFIGSSDDFVIISDCKPVDFIPDKSKIIDSTVKVDSEIYPLNKKLIVGRIPYRFIEYGSKKKRDYYREDWIVAAPKAGERVELNKEIDCFKTENEYIAF
ncbi:MAG: CRISPR-associated protein Cas5 [Thermodesulfovibrionales bacterium]